MISYLILFCLALVFAGFVWVGWSGSRAIEKDQVR